MKNLLFTVLMMLGLAHSAHAAIDLQRPDQREFIRDQAGMISDADAKQIRATCDKLLTEKAIPIVVVTIDSMAAHGGQGMTIDQFAKTLMDQWGVGTQKLNNQEWNRGILVLVSRDDHKARIQFAGGWHHERDADAARIMSEQMVPQFKQRNFSQGITDAVKSLDAVARQVQKPKAVNTMPAAPTQSQGHSTYGNAGPPRGGNPVETGGGFSWLTLLLIVVGVFFLFRILRGVMGAGSAAGYGGGPGTGYGYGGPTGGGWGSMLLGGLLGWMGSSWYNSSHASRRDDIDTTSGSGGGGFFGGSSGGGSDSFDGGSFGGGSSDSGGGGGDGGGASGDW